METTKTKKKAAKKKAAKKLPLQRQHKEKVDAKVWETWKIKRAPGAVTDIMAFSEKNKLKLHKSEISTALNYGIATERTREGINAYFKSLEA